MKALLHLLAALAIANCAPDVKVTRIEPTRAGFDTRNPGAPLDAADRYLTAAESAWHRLDRNPADLEARRDYNFAVSRLLGTLRDAKLEPWKSPLRVGHRTLSWKRDPRPDWNPALYEPILTDELEIGGNYVDVRETKDGLGAPLVAKRNAGQPHEYAPTAHFYYTATAVVRFQGSRCELAFEDPLAKEDVRVGDHTFPLAAGYTAPLALMLEEMQPEKLGLPRLLHPAKFASTTRIARLSTFDPDKTVILFVHGLMDSPGTWFPLMNHLRADPEVRKHYQFWFFSYPSGYPYPYSAAILRRELDEAEKRFPMNKKMVVIGHSMGGCISRLLVTDSERRIWDTMFTVPPEKMDLTPEHRHILTETTIFRHRPEIGRVIFISAPHHGADLATSWIGRLGTKLVQLPTDMLALGREEARYEKHVQGDLHLKRFPDSVDTLAPNNDFVLALKPIPISSGIPFHTILGDRGRGDSPDSSDGYVPYWSSHLAGARSEKIVPSHHSAHQNDEAIREVERILHEHAKSTE
jgi:pimeloyl-ACP methyl ester carboxylesterase